MTPSTGGEAPLLEVSGLIKRYRVRAGTEVVAVGGVDLEIRRGETFAVVGESGCGKSTLARSLLRLVEPDAGRITFDGIDVRALSRSELRRLRRRVQMVFQDPLGSLNPRLRVGAALREVVHVHRLARSGADAAARVDELLEMVGLDRTHLRALPHELSGGQRQRVGIARALAVEPDLIVLDEPVSALDVSVRAQVVNLLADLQERRNLTYLLIAHDLALVEHVSDRVAVMRAGRFVETGDAESVYRTPRDPYTRELLAAIPQPVVADPPADEGA